MTGPLSRRIDQLEQAVAMAVTAECSEENPAGADANFPGTDDPIVIHHALIDQIRQVHLRKLEILRNAERIGRADLVLKSIREARSNVELLARLTGQLDENPTAVHAMAFVVIPCPPGQEATMPARSRNLIDLYETQMASIAETDRYSPSGE